MTPRSELIFDHEMHVDADTRGAFTVIGVEVRGYTADQKTILWSSIVEWATPDEAIVLVVAARNTAGRGTKRIRCGDRILVTWG